MSKDVIPYVNLPGANLHKAFRGKGGAFCDRLRHLFVLISHQNFRDASLWKPPHQTEYPLRY